MSKMFRVFVAHNKSDGEDIIQACVDEFQRKYSSKADLTFTLGRDDYTKNFKRLGSWQGWIRNVVHGSSYGSTEKTYNLILCPSRVVGKATAQIITEALAVRTQVVVRAGNESFQRVTGVQRSGSEEWKDGWILQTEGQ